MNCGNLTDAELIQQELASIDPSEFLIETGLAYTFSVSADNYGGHTPTWTAQTSTFACAVTTEKPQEAVRLGERLLDQTANYEITTGISVDLKVRDRIVIASTTYEIQGVQEKSTLSVTNHYWCSIVTGF